MSCWRIVQNNIGIVTKRMSKIPTYTPVNWFGCLPQLVAGSLCCVAGYAVVGDPLGVAAGCLVYLAYSFGSREYFSRDHRRGMRQLRRGDFAAAIGSFHRSYDYFTRQRWLDDYRSVFLMTPSRLCYRESALVNIAFCYVQLGNGPEAIKYYERTLAEFPGNPLAEAALKMAAALQTVPAEVKS